MKIIKIKEKEYKFEFTFEAAMHESCVEKIVSIIDEMTIAQTQNDVKGCIASLAKTPKTVVSMVYAGLLEHHSDEIKNEKDASELIKTYFAEHKEDGTGNFVNLMSLMIETMEEDGFFNMIGLEEIFGANQTEEKTKKVAKTPQDHKTKTTKASVK